MGRTKVPSDSTPRRSLPPGKHEHEDEEGEGDEGEGGEDEDFAEAGGASGQALGAVAFFLDADQSGCSSSQAISAAVA